MPFDAETYAVAKSYTDGKTATLSNIGRYLSTWNCVTGLPGTNPSTIPYTYKTGDYYVVSTIRNNTHSIAISGSTSFSEGTYHGTYSVSFSITSTSGAYSSIPDIANVLGEDGATATGTLHTTDGDDISIVKVIEWPNADNVKVIALVQSDGQKAALTLPTATTLTDTITSGNLKPTGISYTGIASTTIDTNSVDVVDMYRFDGTSWELLKFSNALEIYEKLPTQVTQSAPTTIELADNTEYMLTNVSSLTFTYPSGNFECWVKMTTASSGTVAVTFPTSSYIGAVPVFSNNETWEISIRNSVVVACEVTTA